MRKSLLPVRPSSAQVGLAPIELSVAVYPASSALDRRVSFRIRFDLHNSSDRCFELQSRRWALVDADSREIELRGPCVPGQRPELLPGATYSFSHEFRLVTDWASLDGEFRLMDCESGKLLELPMPRQILATGLGAVRRAARGGEALPTG